MTKLKNLILPLTLVAAATFAIAQTTTAPVASATSQREAKMARRQLMQKLTSDFQTAMQKGSLSAEDRQKAETALAQIQPHSKGTKGTADPQTRHAAMKTIQQMASNPALSTADREVLAKDLADMKAMRHQRG